MGYSNSFALRSLYVVSGISNAGKTTVLNMLARALLTIPGTTNRLQSVVQTDDIDARYVIDIPNVGIVGVCTNGDSGYDTRQALEFFEQHQCVIGCLATRSSATHESVKELGGPLEAGVVLFFELMYLKDDFCTKVQQNIVLAIKSLIMQ